MKNKYITLILVLAFAGCEKFLDSPPEKKDNLIVENTKGLDLLLDYYNIAFDRCRQVILATDDYGLYKDYYDVRHSNYVLNTSFMQEMLWFPERAAQESYYWENQWGKIAYANTVLTYVDDIQGSEADKIRLKEDAHMLRAYEFFELATLYCLPYSEQNRSKLGLPLKQTLSYEESFARKTLGETMDFIEDELNLALQTSEVRSEDNVWRISLAGAQGFAARFYLYLHDYDKALSYANDALSNYNVLVNFESYFEPYMRTFSRGGGTYTGPNGPSDFKWDEFLYSRVMYNHTYQAVPSQELLNLYDQTNDYRYEGLIVEDYSLVWTATPGWHAYWNFGSIGLISGPTTAEMYLIRAECKARDNDIAGAVSDLDELRSYRYKSGTYTGLTVGDFANVGDLVQFIIDERRRESPFKLRWYDIKRINSDPVGIVDPITITRDFYAFDGITVNTAQEQTYVLAPGDPRFAWPIPSVDIQLSLGVLEQNPYN